MTIRSTRSTSTHRRRRCTRSPRARIDLAKRDIAKGHQAVVVEGYTDVMAMHLAGVATAVASCGTAFGDEHLGMLRRLI